MNGTGFSAFFARDGFGFAFIHSAYHAQARYRVGGVDNRMRDIGIYGTVSEVEGRSLLGESLTQV